MDARRAIDMFRRLDVPVLGLIENMSTHICPKCGYEDHVFGEGGVEAEAAKLGLPFLGALPPEPGDPAVGRFRPAHRRHRQPAGGTVPRAGRPSGRRRPGRPRARDLA